MAAIPDAGRAGDATRADAWTRPAACFPPAYRDPGALVRAQRPAEAEAASTPTTGW